ncbi:hypothetical protein RRF57_001891 [Xylaria bambusicola]|uniref:Uncharacterized protein n=1 Tax=Xylaria bambusicola TaxID=326684 RepID=A0AAN7UHW4_9PEZI
MERSADRDRASGWKRSFAAQPVSAPIQSNHPVYSGHFASMDRVPKSSQALLGNLLGVSLVLGKSET